jgi:hypothetical protein
MERSLLLAWDCVLAYNSVEAVGSTLVSFSIEPCLFDRSVEFAPEEILYSEPSPSATFFDRPISVLVLADGRRRDPTEVCRSMI